MYSHKLKLLMVLQVVLHVRVASIQQNHFPHASEVTLPVKVFSLTSLNYNITLHYFLYIYFDD